MLIVQSIIVYGLMIWVMTYCGKIAYNSQYPEGFGEVDMLADKKISFGSMLTKSYYAIPILVFCFFAAVRYRVGVDCEAYKQIFNQILYYNGDNLIAPDIEKGFVMLALLVGLFTNAHYLFMFLLAVLQISLLYFAFRKYTNITFFLGLSIFLTGFYWSLMNGIRQNIVACAFIAMLPLALNKKWLHFAIAVFIASFMHKSAFILLPIGYALYYVPNKIPSVKFQLIAVVICFLLMNKFDEVLQYISEYASFMGYSENRINAYSMLENTAYTFGFRMFMLYFSYIIAIIYSDKMIDFYNSRYFTICYNIFFVAICLKLVFYNNFTIGRLLYYLVCFAPVIISATFFYLWKNNKQNLFIAMLALLLMRTLYEWYAESQNSIFNEAYLYKFDF